MDTHNSMDDQTELIDAESYYYNNSINHKLYNNTTNTDNMNTIVQSLNQTTLNKSIITLLPRPAATTDDDSVSSTSHQSIPDQFSTNEINDPITGVYDEIEIEDMLHDPSTNTYSYPCPCGDKFVISINELIDGEDIARCPSCTLIIRVIYEPEMFDEMSQNDKSDDD